MLTTGMVLNQERDGVASGEEKERRKQRWNLLFLKESVPRAGRARREFPGRPLRGRRRAAQGQVVGGLPADSGARQLPSPLSPCPLVPELPCPVESKMVKMKHPGPWHLGRGLSSPVC